MRRTVVSGVLCLLVLATTVVVASAADELRFLGALYSSGHNCTTYSYMLIIDDSRTCRVGDTLMLSRVAPVSAVGDPVYWHYHEVQAEGNGSRVTWRCTDVPPEDGHIFATFDIIVEGRAGVDFEEGVVDWQLANDGALATGQVTGPVPIGGWTPTDLNGTITGIVYFDADQDGVYDADELLLAGVEVAAYDSSGAEVATATTDDNGAFTLADLPAGTYLVKMVLADNEVRYVVVTTGNADGETVHLEGGDEKHVEFGLYLNTCLIADDAENGTITGEGKSQGYWRHQVALAILCMIRESGNWRCLPRSWRTLIFWGCGSCDCDCSSHRSRRHHRSWCIVSPQQVASWGNAVVSLQCHKHKRKDNRCRKPRRVRCPRVPKCPPAEDVVGILTEVEQLWITEPFQFADGDNGEPVGLEGLIEALQILCGCADLCGTDCGDNGGDDCACQCNASVSMQCHHSHHHCWPKRPRMCWKARLARQLLAAEMNWVTERRSSLGRLEAWLLWYAEWAYNNECKAKATDAGKCLPRALDALNNLGE